MVAFLFIIAGLCLVLGLVGLSKQKAPEAPVPVKKTEVKTKPESSELYFKIKVKDPAPLVRAFSEPNEDYSLSKRELIDFGLVGSRVYKYNVIEGEPEIKDGQVFLDGLLVGSLLKKDIKPVSELIASGLPCSVGIYGGEYKIIWEDIDEDGKESYELEKDESPVSASLRIKKEAL